MKRWSAGFAAAFAAAAVLAFIVVKPLLTTLLGACVLAYLFYPVHKRLRRFLRSDSLSALAVTVLIIMLIVVPAFFVINALTREVIGLVASSSQQECGKNAVCSALGYLRGIDPGLPESLRAMTGSLADAFAKYVASQVSAILLSLSAALFHLSVLFFITFYLLKDGAGISGRVMKLLPLELMRLCSEQLLLRLCRDWLRLSASACLGFQTPCFGGLLPCLPRSYLFLELLPCGSLLP
ncbi:AI-2E family transporter [Candidatus Woesearchaeota archaeon]|nr:AI-2E family transporter [Candidatus Woesearchaeota archaeon]